LIEEVTVWNIFYQYFIYKPASPDEDHEYFHIVNLEKNNATLLVEDFTKGDKSCII
jgi:hypothetical protein